MPPIRLPPPFPARGGRLFDAAMPLTNGAGETMRRMAYNATGEILTVISLPAYAKYLDLQHDAEALRRMVQLKVAALKQRVPARGMTEFLARDGAALGNPYTGEPFEWNDVAGEIRFTAKSKEWKQPSFVVRYAPR